MSVPDNINIWVIFGFMAIGFLFFILVLFIGVTGKKKNYWMPDVVHEKLKRAFMIVSPSRGDLPWDIAGVRVYHPNLLGVCILIQVWIAIFVSLDLPVVHPLILHYEPPVVPNKARDSSQSLSSLLSFKL